MGQWKPVASLRQERSRLGLWTIAYEDLVAIVGGQDLAHLAAGSVEIGAQDLVEIAYEDLVGLANAETLQVGRVVVEGARGSLSKSAGTGASAQSGKPAPYVWVSKRKTIEAGFWEPLAQPRPRIRAAVAAVRG